MNQGFLQPVGAALARAASPSCAGSRWSTASCGSARWSRHREVERDARVRERLAGARRDAFGARRQPARAQPGDGRRRAGRRRLRLRSRRRCCRRSARAGRAALDARRARRVRRGADPRLLRDVHRARRAAGRGARPGGARAGRVPQVPLALERGPAVRRRRGGARATDELRVVVGAVAETPQHYPDVCALARGRRSTRALADRDRRAATPSASSRSTTRAARPAYRRRVTAVEVRRAIEALAA